MSESNIDVPQLYAEGVIEIISRDNGEGIDDETVLLIRRLSYVIGIDAGRWSETMDRGTPEEQQKTAERLAKTMSYALMAAVRHGRDQIRRVYAGKETAL